MNEQHQRVALNPVHALVDDGCPNYRGVEELPALVPDGPDPRSGEATNDGDDLGEGAR